MKSFIAQASSLALILTLLSSCSHAHTRGSVVFSDSPTEGHVCLGENEVKPGDNLNVYRTECKSTEVQNEVRGGKRRTICSKFLLGKAKVSDTSSEHFARVEALNGLVLKEGQIVEKATEN